MTKDINVHRTDIRILADPKKVLLRSLNFGINTGRINPVVAFVEGLSDAQVNEELDKIKNEFGERHDNLFGRLTDNYKIVSKVINIPLSDNQQLLVGAYFSNEYSTQASALFNPSIVPYPPEKNDEDNTISFLLSLRATGEGHISSIAFQTGKINDSGEIIMDNTERKIQEGQIKNFKLLPKDYISALFPGEQAALDALPNMCSLKKVLEIATTFQLNPEPVQDLFKSSYQISFSEETPISSRVLFPKSSQESMGMEDARFVKMEDEDAYIGTYTAYNGRNIRPQLIKTKDFKTFSIFPLLGKAAMDKGVALFPRKIKGEYVMIGRQDGRNLTIMKSNNLLVWDQYQFLQGPSKSWDMLQIGNNGSPLETADGWLLLTHAVGPMRKYTLSLSLLDLENPSIVKASLEQPLMSPNSEEREGYVPNVLYTCGMISHNGALIIPYAMSDSAISFATVSIIDVLNKLKTQ